MSSSRRFVIYPLRFLAAIASLLSIVFVSGCGSREPFSYVPASGTVSYDDGTPIAAPSVRLTFIAINPPSTGDAKVSARPGFANVEDVKTGVFSSVTSHKYGDGLLAGKHKVIVIAQDERDRPLEGVVAPEYSNENKTPLVVDTNDPSSFQIKVKKPAGGVKSVEATGGR